MTLREKIEVMEAFERGEEIEVSYVKQEKWTDVSNPDWAWGAYNYRIKPKPKQVFVLETWLCKTISEDDNDSKCFFTVEANNVEMQSYFRGKYSSKAIKLLSTMEVEID